MFLAKACPGEKIDSALESHRSIAVSTIRIVMFVFVAAACGFCSSPARQQAKVCTNVEQKKVMSATPRDWNSFYFLFKQLSHCDDGGMAENFSDNVVRLLGRRWKYFPQLGKLASSDLNFRQFVLKHVDSTTDPRDLRAASANAHQRCPAGDAQLCGLIESEAKAALAEQSKLTH